MKWLESKSVHVGHLLVTAVTLVVLLLGEPECAAALARAGLLPL